MAGEETLPSDGPRSPVPGLEKPGDSIGPYVLRSVLGSGGFGTVWMAERRQPFVQRVAVKIVRAGMDTQATLARFEQERQALAMMDHPNIAKVFDGGMTPAGRPYFAMEFVDGKPITEFCDAASMSTEERLRLFMQVCDAVQHAHHKLIIHRDLKPGNVLVATGAGGEPQAKVIDFGIAKAISGPLVDATIVTRATQTPGTPEYMSPEQAAGAADIDTRADIYALGVILYELLTGFRPFESADLRARGDAEMLRIIREEDPPLPSVRLAAAASTDRDARTRIAQAHHAQPETLARSLRAELEWIPMKALRKSRDERYGSAADLARDVANYLDGRPLQAGPESAAYRVRKFVRRNRGLVLASSAVACAVVAGLSVATWQWRVAARALADARAMNEFVQEDVFGGSDVDRYDEGVRAVDLVRDAAGRVDDRFGDDPALRARMRLSMGRALLGVGSPAEAVPVLEAALADERALDAADAARVRLALAEALYRSHGGSDPERSAALAREALADARRVGNRDLVSDALNHLGGALKQAGSLDESEAAYRESLAIRQADLPPSRIEVHVVRGNLELVALSRAMLEADPAAACRAFEASAGEFGALRDAAVRDLGPEHAQAISMGNEHATAWLRASLVIRGTDPSAADALAAKSVEAFGPLHATVSRRLAPTHFRRVWVCGNYARALADLGRRGDAIAVLQPLYAEVPDGRRSPLTPDLLALARMLAGMLDREGRHPEAVGVMARALDWARSGPDADAAGVVAAMSELADRSEAAGQETDAADWRRLSQDAAAGR